MRSTGGADTRSLLKGAGLQHTRPCSPAGSAWAAHACRSCPLGRTWSSCSTFTWGTTASPASPRRSLGPTTWAGAGAGGDACEPKLCHNGSCQHCSTCWPAARLLPAQALRVVLLPTYPLPVHTHPQLVAAYLANQSSSSGSGWSSPGSSGSGSGPNYATMRCGTGFTRRMELVAAGRAGFWPSRPIGRWWHV